jgi:hypothetical protein
MKTFDNAQQEEQLIDVDIATQIIENPNLIPEAAQK